MEAGKISAGQQGGQEDAEDWTLTLGHNNGNVIESEFQN